MSSLHNAVGVRVKCRVHSVEQVCLPRLPGGG